MKRFFEGRKAESLMVRLGKRFHITNYEVTYGKNGWHPHHHILIFSDKYLGITEYSELETELKNTGLIAVVFQNFHFLTCNMV